MGNGRVNGKLIVERRKAQRLTVEALAAEIGVSTSLMRAIEKDYMPREKVDEIIAGLARVLGISADTLVTPPAKDTA